MVKAVKVVGVVLRRVRPPMEVTGFATFSPFRQPPGRKKSVSADSGSSQIRSAMRSLSEKLQQGEKEYYKSLDDVRKSCNSINKNTLR